MIAWTIPKAKEIKAASFSLPVLMRFSDNLRHRVETLCGAFDSAMQADGYRGDYTSVYPIKVNQQKAWWRKSLRAPMGAWGWRPAPSPNY